MAGRARRALHTDAHRDDRAGRHRRFRARGCVRVDVLPASGRRILRRGRKEIGPGRAAVDRVRRLDRERRTGRRRAVGFRGECAAASLKRHKEAAEQLQDETAEEKRAYCKLHFGIPILRAESDDFRDTYDRIIRPMSYEQKLELMAAPIDFPVTRIMTVKQKTQFLDAVFGHYTSLGVQLTMPEQQW